MGGSSTPWQSEWILILIRCDECHCYITEGEIQRIGKGGSKEVGLGGTLIFVTFTVDKDRIPIVCRNLNFSLYKSLFKSVMKVVGMDAHARTKVGSSLRNKNSRRRKIVARAKNDQTDCHKNISLSTNSCKSEERTNESNSRRDVLSLLATSSVLLNVDQRNDVHSLANAKEIISGSSPAEGYTLCLASHSTPDFDMWYKDIFKPAQDGIIDGKLGSKSMQSVIRWIVMKDEADGIAVLQVFPKSEIKGVQEVRHTHSYTYNTH